MRDGKPPCVFVCECVFVSFWFNYQTNKKSIRKDRRELAADMWAESKTVAVLKITQKLPGAAECCGNPDAYRTCCFTPFI